MSRFMEIKSVKQKLRQDQIAKELGCSSSNYVLISKLNYVENGKANEKTKKWHL